MAAAAATPPVPLPSGKRAHEHEVPAAIGARQVPERARLREILERCGLCRRHCGTGRPCRGVGEVGHGSAPQHAPRGGVVGVRGLLGRRRMDYPPLQVMVPHKTSPKVYEFMR